jgi:vancomycin resistance protein YoaR
VRRPSRRQLVVGAAVVGGLAVAYGVLLLAAGSGVPRGTTVAGVDIGGLSPAAATARLEQELGARSERPLTVTAEDRSFALQPATAGLSFDAAATVASAAHRPLDPVGLVRRLFGGVDVSPVVRVDDAKLAGALGDVAAEVDHPAREGGVRFTAGQPVAVPPLAGYGVQRAAAERAVADAYLVRTGPVALPLGELAPMVSAADVQAALQGYATTAVSAPVRLVVAKRQVVVVPRTFAPYLALTARDGRLVPELDAAGLERALKRPLAGLERAPVDATFRLTGGSPEIVASRPGTQIPLATLASGFVEAAGRSSDRVVRVAVVPVQPRLTTAKANKLGVVEKISSFTTHYPYAAYRLQNIHRAADLVDGTVLLPGQVFSLNRIVGERTAANGFAIGTIINEGRFAKDYGGGTSQVATTTFNAAFFAGLKILEHKTHSFYISRYPAGREATVAWPDVDLRFQNDSGHAIVIDTSYTDSTVTVAMWGTKVWDIESVSSARYNERAYGVVYDPTPACVVQGGVDGFDIDVTRVFTRGGVVVRREPFHTHYAPAAQVYCHAKPGPPPSPSPSPSGSHSPSPSPSPSVSH